MSKRQPDYDTRSDKVEKECANDVALKAARDEIFKELRESVNVIKTHRFADDPSVAVRAAKEHLTLAGLYVDRVEHSGSVAFEPLKISRESLDA